MYPVEPAGEAGRGGRPPVDGQINPCAGNRKLAFEYCRPRGGLASAAERRDVAEYNPWLVRHGSNAE
jgi:hypothetical protein